MKNQVVLITGALTGIGRATAFAFAKKGAHVVVSGRRDDAGQALACGLQALGVEAAYIRADVRNEEEVKNLIERTVSRFGKLDVAVNNAATEGQIGPITDQTAETVAATFDTNVVGVVLCMKHEILAMQANSGKSKGNIINISSTFGHRAAALASIYVASKHAVEGITKSVALEVASSGIRVNGVSPGPTDTEMADRFRMTLTRLTVTDDCKITDDEKGINDNKVQRAKQIPLGRLGLSEDVADGIVFMASDEARFITGHILNVDGGHTAAK